MHDKFLSVYIAIAYIQIIIIINFIAYVDSTITECLQLAILYIIIMRSYQVKYATDFPI